MDLNTAIVAEGRSAVFEHGQRSRGMLRNEDPVQCDPFQAYYQRKATPR
jgi:hypothetical protein